MSSVASPESQTRAALTRVPKRGETGADFCHLGINSHLSKFTGHNVKRLHTLVLSSSISRQILPIVAFIRRQTKLSVLVLFLTPFSSFPTIPVSQNSTAPLYLPDPSSYHRIICQLSPMALSSLSAGRLYTSLQISSKTIMLHIFTR
jgi:hypothetical protein